MVGQRCQTDRCSGQSKQDRKPDLADLCIVRMSELNPHHVVVTIDEADFRGYRRNERDVIPLLCPPKAYRPQ